MTKKEWDEMPYPEYLWAFKKFMYDIENEFNCEECPENRGHRGRWPCGQQNCWVTCHCYQK